MVKRDPVRVTWIDGKTAKYTLSCGHVVTGKPRNTHPPAMRCEECEREAQE